MSEMILPKGIVTNTSWIYEEVAGYPVVPPEKIQKYWRVYTTTFTRLVDPTANRLENFWWHVWGSDRRDLPGPVLARLFEDISNGPTFVKLRSTANRYEGPSEPASPITPGAAQRSDHGTKLQVVTQHEQDQATSPSESDLKVNTPPKMSSSQKQPPAKPILKKPRGPSSSGPRPVARFVSPAGSDAEDAASSASTAINYETDSKEPSSSSVGSRSDKKKGGPGTPKKKGSMFVASSASRRRPGMFRRPSSQSSAGGSEIGLKESGSVSSKFSGSQRSVETITENTSVGTPSETSEQTQQPSAKAAGKRPVTNTLPSIPSKLTGSKVTHVQNYHPAPEFSAAILDDNSDGSSEKKVIEPTKASLGSELFGINYTDTSAGRRRESIPERVAPHGGAVMSRSRSDIGSSRAGTRDWNPSRRVPPLGLTSTTTVDTTNATAQGTIIEFDENSPALEAVQNSIHDRDEPLPGIQRSATGSSTSSRLVPTQPSPTPSVPLGRSKSQLTLLLERQGDEKRSRR